MGKEREGGDEWQQQWWRDGGDRGDGVDGHGGGGGSSRTQKVQNAFPFFFTLREGQTLLRSAKDSRERIEKKKQKNKKDYVHRAKE